MNKIKNFGLIRAFSDSCKEFKSIRSIVTAALLVALHTAMACYLSIVVTDSLRISISFLANVVIGAMFGPVMGFVCGGVGDIIQFVIKPTGPYFIGWTISASLAGLLYGIMFYNKTPKVMKKTDADSTKEAEIDAVRNKKDDLITRILGVLLNAASIISWFVLPFAKVKMSSDSGTIEKSGSAFSTIIDYNNGSGNKDMMMVACILLVVSILLLIVIMLKYNKIALILSVMACFASILAAYTIRKSVTVESGFYVITIIYILLMALLLWRMCRKHSVDITFMVRIALTLTIETMLINVLLGTYWVSFMYGKGFAFYFTSRLIKNVIQLPINIVLTYYILGLVREMKRRLN